MSKGKYAERARNKADADRRHAIAVAEGNELRRTIHELRNLRSVNEQLHARIKQLEQQVAEGSSDRVAEAEGKIAFLETDRHLLVAQQEKWVTRANKALLDLADTMGNRGSQEWYEAAALVYNQIGKTEGMKDNIPLIVKHLRESWGDAKENMSGREITRRDRLNDRQGQRRAARRPRRDNTAEALSQGYTKREEARLEKTRQGKPETEPLT